MDVDPLLRVLIAAALGVPVGLDREFRGKSAGLRTHAVVAAACAALGAVSVLAAPQSATGADGTRIAAQVVSGIGFIGAGVIFVLRRPGAVDSIMAGAAGYLLKQIRGTDLVDGIRRVAAGGSMLDPAVTARVLERVRNPQPREDPRLGRLTPTEERIVEMIASGLTNRQIGEHLHLAEKTVKNYVSTVLTKLEVARRAEAAVYWSEHRPRS